MKIFCKITGLILILSLCFTFTSYASVLWYNGDFNGVNGLANENIVPTISHVYDDFIVPDSGWLINSIWTNNLMGFANATGAEWEIRQGISNGDGGSIVYSGTSLATQAATGNYFSLGPGRGGYYEYTIKVDGLNLSLSAGRYWLMVAPIGYGYEQSFASTTSGTNATGSPSGNNGNAYWDSRFFSANFQLTTDYYAELVDFSMGVGGSVAGSVIPEPATLSFLGSGLLGLLSLRSKHA